MRSLMATAGVLAGLLLVAAPALAHKSDRAPQTKPAVEKTVIETKPAKAEPAPRICLFSVNGKVQEPKPVQPAADAKKKEKPAPQPRERVCNIATPPAPMPLG